MPTSADPITSHAREAEELQNMLTRDGSGPTP